MTPQTKADFWRAGVLLLLCVGITLAVFDWLWVPSSWDVSPAARWLLWKR